LLAAVENGAAPFSVEDKKTGELRRAYADDLTDGQIKFIFHARQEIERMKSKQIKRKTRNH